MILDTKKTTLAYRCPSCGCVTTSAVGVFSLSGDMFKLKCGCGNSFVTVEKHGSDHIHVTVPCVACSKPHYYNISSSLFFGTDVLLLPCSVCGIDLCFIGKEDEVSQAILKSNDEISSMLGDLAIDKLKSEENEDMVDPQVYEIVRFVVSELNDEGNIRCYCKDGDGDYDCEITAEDVSIKCRKCGASKKINIVGTIAAHDFLNNTTEIILE